MEEEYKYDLYDYICKKTKKTIRQVSLEDICKHKKILVLSGNFGKVMDKFFETAFRGNIEACYVVYRQQMYSLLEKWNADEKIKLVKWEGNYNDELKQYLEQTLNLNEIEAVLYFSLQVLNIRDINILEMIEGLTRCNKIETYCMERHGDEYRIEDINVMCKGLKIYQDINDFLDL